MSRMTHGLSRFDTLLKESLNHHALNNGSPLPQVFGYLHEANPVTGNLGKEAIVAGFDALVATMRTSESTNGKADAGMTFFGQFVDHDITLDVQSAIGTRIDPRSIRNVRTPNLDLDCVYGDGPDGSPYLYSSGNTEGYLLFGREDNPYDLARNCKGRALIGDPRNDENIIVSQVQGAFVALHNILMSHLVQETATATDIRHCAHAGIRTEVWETVIPSNLMKFEEVRRFIRLHYQWVVLNELLPAFVDKKTIASTLARDPFGDKGPIIPAEFSGAAYRFGHATVRPSYCLRKGEAPVDLFTMRGFSPRGPESTIEMAQFFDVAGTRAQKALPVGVKMAETLFELPDNIVGGGLVWGDYKIELPKAKKLALRNILRDRTSLELPSGQQMAAFMGMKPLPLPQVLKDHDIDKTPLWYYCLQEAETKGQGRLTGVGGSIVASTLIRLLKLDPESVIHNPDFFPWAGFGETCTLGNIMQFVENHRDDVVDRESLYCGPVL